jgi:hypothetical protein
MHARKRPTDGGDTSPTVQTTSDRRMGESLFDIDHNNELFGICLQFFLRDGSEFTDLVGSSCRACGTPRRRRALQELNPHSEQFK